MMSSKEAVRQKYSKLNKTFNERQKRLWAASEALEMGHGGVSIQLGVKLGVRSGLKRIA